MRKTVELNLIDRETEKTFVIKEMNCIQSQAWLLEVANVLVKSGLLKIADDVQGENFSLELVVSALLNGGFAKLTSIDSEGAQELLLKLLGCCSYKLGAQTFKLDSQNNIDQYVDDLKTLFCLEKEAFKVNFGFFTAVSNSTSQDKSAKAPKKLTTKA